MGIIKKTKKGFQKSLVKGNKIFLKKKKTKDNNMLVSDIDIFLNNKKKRRVKMVVNAFLKDEKQRLVEYIKKLI